MDAELHNMINKTIKKRTLAEELERLRNRIGSLWFFTREYEDY
jgi:hypothetical protein